MSPKRERRYPPTPFPPRSEATRRYRAAWDRGWQMTATLRRQALNYLEGRQPGSPEWTGFRDGVVARLRFEEKAREVDPAILRAEEDAAVRRRRESAADERPY